MLWESEWKTITVELREHGVLFVQLSRPKSRNAVTGTMIKEVEKMFDDADKSPKVRAIVLTGDPKGRAFSAGADLSPELDQFGNSSKKPKAALTMDTYRDGGGYTSLAAVRCSKPVIAAVNSVAVGWGLALAVAADIRVASASAKIGFPMTARGLVNESISSYLLPRLIGVGYAKEMVFTGKVMLAKDAPIGLFNHVVPEEAVLDKAFEIANLISMNTSSLSVSISKKLMDHGWNSTPEEAFINESNALYHVSYVKNADLKEGIASFLEKRKPNWMEVTKADFPDTPIYKEKSKL